MEVKAKIIVVLLVACFSSPVNAQEHIIPLDTLGIHRPAYKAHRLPVFDNAGDIDLIDLGNGILNKFPDRNLDTAHIGVGKLHSSLLPGIGYSIETKFEVELSYLGGFYTSNESNANQSSILATAIYTQLHQLLIPVVGNI